MKKINGIIMQYFEWYLRPENKLWNKGIWTAIKTYGIK